MKNIITVNFNKVNYDVDVEKVLYIISLLKNSKVTCNSEDEFKQLLSKYKLYDEVFLSSVSLGLKNLCKE